MYSLSSQLFEGVTEYVLSEKSHQSDNSESQKGPFGSGKVLGDILKQSERKTEMRFLNDFSYSLFEKKLLEEENVIEVQASHPRDIFGEQLSGKSFVKIKAKAVFNDMRTIHYMLKNFNSLGKSIAHVTSFEELSKVKSQIEILKSTTKDKSRLRQISTQEKTLLDINKLAKEKGLHQDQNFLNDLSFLLDYFFKDQMEIQMKLHDSIFSASLKRESLREDENLVIRKYSRTTEIDFVLFGIVTQCKGDNASGLDDPSSELCIKKVLMNIVGLLSNLETTVFGRLKNEVIIDPIALYTELN
jgi:hypothetical protein